MAEGEKKKIAVLSCFYDPQPTGGAEVMVKELLERLGDSYEFVLVTGRFDKQAPKTEKKANYRIVRVGLGHKGLDKFLYIILGALSARKEKPAIAHAVMESYAGGALFILKRIAPGIKRILTLQSGDLDDDRKQAVFYIRFFWKMIHRSPDQVIAISRFLAKRALKLGVCKDNIRIIPNGVDLSVIPQGMAKAPYRVFNHSRFSWEKAHEYIIAAWPQVLEKFNQAKLVLLNDGPEKAKIAKQVKDLGLESSVIMKGRMPQAEALKELAAAAIFICPSLAEGLGNVFIEAQAAGTVPIGTRVGGIPDVIEDGVNGLLIEPKDSGQIADAIIKLFSDKELYQRLQANGLVNAKRFEWAKVMAEIEAVYSSVL